MVHESKGWQQVHIDWSVQTGHNQTKSADSPLPNVEELLLVPMPMIRRLQQIFVIRHIQKHLRRVRRLDLEHALAVRRRNPSRRSSAVPLMQDFVIGGVGPLDVE